MKDVFKYKVAVLGYGSLLDDPGSEIGSHIIKNIECITPFQVEYARLSVTRDNAPTLVPLKAGRQGVKAQLLILDESVSVTEAENMLWRRETRRIGSGKVYQKPDRLSKNSVTIEQLHDFHEVETALYTVIPSNMGILNTPTYLSHFAIQSTLGKAGENQLDGIRYLRNNIRNGIITPLTEAYKNEILKQTKTTTLDDAIAFLDGLRPAQLQKQEDMETFERKVREIAYYAFEYGLNVTYSEEEQKSDSLQQLMQSRQESFMSNCHTGFKKAQDLALVAIMDFQERRLFIKDQVKEAHRSKNKNRLQKLKAEVEVLKFKESVIRHIIDAILWQMIQGQLYISRRLYQNVDGDKILKHSNITSVKFVVDEINKDPNDFALITDLTSYAQVGDIYAITKGSFIIGEVKEGDRNLKIIEILKEIQRGGKSVEEAVVTHQLSEKDVEQLHRQKRQEKTMQNFVDIVNRDEGIDSQTGQPITIITPHEETPRFTIELQKLEKQLSTRNLWGYTVIDDCLHIGIYKGPFKMVGMSILRALANQNTKEFIIIDFLRVIQSFHKPLFTSPFSKELVFDLLFGRVKLLFMLDLDAYISLADKAGLVATWASPKETNKAKSTLKGIFIHNGRGIKISPKEQKGDNQLDIWLGHGNINKMLFEHIVPFYTMYSCHYHFGFKQHEKDIAG